jgi:uncharacterized protein YodC (DUF2158 family)
VKRSKVAIAGERAMQEVKERYGQEGPVPGELYPPGSVVQLRSGGPVLAVAYTHSTGYAVVVYYNSVTGKIEQHSVQQNCLKPANTAPAAPEGAEWLRNTSVTRSSL